MGMVRHMVICRFKPETSSARVDQLLSLILGMKGKIPGILGIEAGPYESPEGMNADYTHGFLVPSGVQSLAYTFEDWIQYDTADRRSCVVFLPL